jgi:HK97 family phage prohead protease
MRRSQPFEIKLADEATGSFEGIASVYGNVDSYGDIVEAGAFSKTIAERGRSVPILWQHDSRLPIGTGEVYDAGGHLGIKGRIIDSVSYGADALKLIREGVVKGLSIGYTVLKDAWDADRKVRLLKEIKLFEVSVVTFPANELAMLTGVKSDSRDELIAAAYYVIDELKAGRMLSAANRAQIQAAIETLSSLLAAAEADEKSKQPLAHCEDIIAILRDIRGNR